MRCVTIMDKKQLYKLIAYFVMGDGGVYYKDKSSENCMFIMNMRKINFDYVEWVGSVLKNVTSVTIREVKNYNTDGYNRQPLLRIESKAHPIFTKMRERIYTDKYKGIDPHYLKLLDWEALAILYMSDGSFSIEKPNPKKGLIHNSYGVNLNMKRLSYGDQFLLKTALKKNLDLEWNINKHNQYYYLRMRNKDINKFMNGIRKYMLPSFEYKILTENSL